MITQFTSVSLSTPTPPAHITSTADAIIDMLRDELQNVTFKEMVRCLGNMRFAEFVVDGIEADVAILPSEHGTSAQVVLAASSGLGGLLDLASQVQAIHNYAPTPRGEPLVAILLADAWHVERHLPDLRAITASGVQIRVLLGGEGINGLVELPLDLAVPLMPHAQG